MDLDSQHLTLIDPQDLSVLNVQAIQSIRVWGVGRDNGRSVLANFSKINGHFLQIKLTINFAMKVYFIQSSHLTFGAPQKE